MATLLQTDPQIFNSVCEFCLNKAVKAELQQLFFCV